MEDIKRVNFSNNTLLISTLKTTIDDFLYWFLSISIKIVSFDLLISDQKVVPLQHKKYALSLALVC